MLSAAFFDLQPQILSRPGQIRILGCVRHENEKLFADFQNKFVCSMCPGPFAIGNNIRESNGQGCVIYVMCPLILNLRRILFHFRGEYFVGVIRKSSM